MYAALDEMRATIVALWERHLVVKFKFDHDQEAWSEAEDQEENVRPLEGRKGPYPAYQRGRSLWQAPKKTLELASLDQKLDQLTANRCQ